MGYPHAINLQTVTTIGAVGMALLVIGIRLRAAQKPTSARKIIIPPLGMTTGFFMFLFPQTHIPFSYAIGALAAGLFFSFPLIRTSKFEVHNGDIYLKRSKAFPLILLSLLAIRMALRGFVEQFVTLPQTGAIFFLLAYGMIVPWRVAMLRRYTQLKRSYSKTR